MEFTHKEEEVQAEIAELQARIPNLQFHDTHQAISTGPLVRGCEICTHMAHLSFQLGFRCNAHCPFCFLPSYQADAPHEDEQYNRRALLKRFLRHQDELAGVALTGGEPLLYLAELAANVAEMRRANPDVHFWVYTNGILADAAHLQQLHALGITEIRFNLAATNYHAPVMANLARARELFEYLVVEVPTYPPQREQLMGCLDDLARIGIDQLNLQEVLVTAANVARLEGTGYQSGVLFLKKHFLYGSRQLTYAVMARCVEAGYAFTVNDCSAGRYGKK